MTRPSRPEPLLTFPPAATATAQFASEYVVKKSRLLRTVQKAPLLFIALCYGYAAYAYLGSLVIGYLLLDQRKYFKSFAYTIIFLWLEGSAACAVSLAVYRGGGAVTPSARDIEDGIRLSPPPTRRPASNQRERVDPPLKPKYETTQPESAGLLQPEESEEDDEIDDSKPLSLMTNSSKLVARSGRAKSDQSGFEFAAALKDMEQQNFSSASGRTNDDDAAWGDGGTGVQVKSDGTARWCRKCCVPKPDRAHHCSSCQTCVLKMDHHCGWLGGCVGYANYKLFLLFLWYSALLGGFVSVTTIFELINFVSLAAENVNLAPISWALVFFEGIIFGICVGMFGLYHAYLCLTNRTTIEAMERSPSILPQNLKQRTKNFRADYSLTREERRRLDRASSKLNPYDCGYKQNFRQVFGDDMRMWFCPFGAPPGDGYSFPINRENLRKLAQITQEIRYKSDEMSDDRNQRARSETSEDSENSANWRRA